MLSKIELIHTDEFGNISTASLQSDLVCNRDGVVEWFLHTGLLSLGFREVRDDLQENNTKIVLENRELREALAILERHGG